MILSTSWMSLRFSARGSLTSMAITFQSVSPSSIIAKTPRTFTLRTVPLKTKKVFFSPGSFHRPTYLGWIKNLPGVDGWTNFADVDRIVVSLAVGGWIGVVGVLPGLHGHVHDKYKYVQKYKSRQRAMQWKNHLHLRNGPIVPDVPMVWETVCYISAKEVERKLHSVRL